MSKVKLKINSNIEVVWENEEYKSTVQDIEEDNIKISIPVKNGTYLMLDEGAELDFTFLEDSYNCYSFTCEIKGRFIDNNIALYVLSLPYNIKKIQRRNFVRVQAVEYTFYKNKDEEEDWKKGLIVDLSGGGLRIKVKEKVKLNEYMLVNIIHEDEKIQVKGEVVRIVKTDDKQYLCGLTFVNLDEKTREKIIGKVFTLMRKQRELM